MAVNFYFKYMKRIKIPVKKEPIKKAMRSIILKKILNLILH